MVAHTCYLSYAEGINRMITVVQLARECKTLFKRITKAKRDRGMAQVVEHPPSKGEAQTPV
jgi:hypothetical protein